MTKSDSETFGGWLKMRRGVRTQDDFAAELKGVGAAMNQSYLGRIERGERPPNVALCLAIARVEELPPNFVLDKAGLPLISGDGEDTSAYDGKVEEFRIVLSRFVSARERERAARATIAMLKSLLKS